MSDTNVSTEAAGASTSAPAEPVEQATSTPASEPVATPDPFESSDPWANIGDDAKADKEKQEDKPAANDETPAAEKPAEEAKTDDDTPLEDQVLAEAFADETPDDKKTPEAEPSEEDLDNQDPEAMIAAQRNKTARLWAERNAKKAEIVKEFQHDTSPIETVAEKLKELAPERFTQLSQHAAHTLVDANPDATFQRAYAVKMLSKDPNWDPTKAAIPTLDELIAGHGTAGTENTPLPSDIAEITAGLTTEIDWDWRNADLDSNFMDDRERAMAQALRAMEATTKAAAAERDDLKGKLESKAAEKPATSEPTDEQKAVGSILTGEIIPSYRKSVEEKILPFIAKNTGLEVSPDDTPEIATFKQRKLELYTGTEYQRANGQDSAFESFAYNESTVRKELETVIGRVVDSQLKEARARHAGNTADADKYHREAEDEKVPLMTLLAQANKEFKTRYITPDMELIGKLSGNLAAPRIEASSRQEIVSNGSGTGDMKPKQPDLRTADDVWDNVVKEAETDQALRAGA